MPENGRNGRWIGWMATVAGSIAVLALGAGANTWRTQGVLEEKIGTVSEQVARQRADQKIQDARQSEIREKVIQIEQKMEGLSRQLDRIERKLDQ